MLQLIKVTSQASPHWDSLVSIYLDAFPIDERRPLESIAHLLATEPRYAMYAIIYNHEELPECKHRDETNQKELSSFKGDERRERSERSGGRQEASSSASIPALGLLTTWSFDEFVYVEHFAISSSLRSQGYGTEVLSTFIQSQQKPLILEAEPPTDETTRRRIRFYERHGLTLFDFPYMQPAYTAESQPVPLCLMGTLDPSVTPLAQVSRVLHSKVYEV